MKQFILDYNSKTEPLKHYWEMCVGSCHGTTALREDYREQLEKCHKELGFRYVRFHGLLDDDMSVLTKRGMIMQRDDSEGEYVVSFTNTDSIFDFLLSINMKPFIEIGFMPECLKSGDTMTFHYKGLTSPPNDYDKWSWLIETFAAHLAERYGLDEVRQWYFEVWNEPNLGGPGQPMGFWGGTMEEYFKLYSYTANALKKVDKGLKVGGPATADNSWVPEIIEFCRKNNAALDFISTHHYPTDVVLGYRSGHKMEPPKDGEDGEVMFKKMLEMQKDMWKKVPRGVLTEMTKEVAAQAGDLPVIYTEWNSGAGIQSDGPFGSSFIAKTILDSTGLVEGYSYWTFSDIFEEGGMPHKPFHGGFGLLNLQGIPKATYRAFEFLHKLGDEIYTDKQGNGTVDVYAVKKNVSNSLQIMIVNHESLLHEIHDENIKIHIKGCGSIAKATVERIDEEHGNALRHWEKMGRPDYLKDAEIYEIMSSSYIKAETFAVKAADGEYEIELDVSAMGIALVTLYL